MKHDASEAGAYLATADVARLVDLTPAAVRLAANTGRLAVAMRTPGGVRLFAREAVEQFRQQRADRLGPGETA